MTMNGEEYKITREDFNEMCLCGHPDPVGEEGEDGIKPCNNQKWWEQFNKHRKKVWRV